MKQEEDKSLESNPDALAVSACEDQLAGIIASAMDAIITFNEREEITLFNNAAERMFLCPAGDALRSKIDRFIPERMRAAHSQHIRKFGETKVTQRTMGALGALSGLRTNGEEFAIEASISQIEAGGGTLFTVILRDITQRRKSEQELKRFAAIVESADDAIVSKTLDGMITSWNPAAEKMFGYTAAEIIGQPVLKLTPPEKRHEEEEILARIRRGERVQHLETVRLRKDGTTVDVSVSISPVKDEQDQMAGASTILRDITQRKAAERALRESEERFHDLFENANDLIQSVGPDGGFLFVNRAWEETLGYTAEEASRMKIFDVLDESCREHSWETFKRAMAGENVGRIEVIFKGRDDRRVLVEGAVSCRFQDGQPAATRGIFRDLTDRQRIYGQLAEQAALLDQTQDAIIVRDMDGLISFWSKGAERLYGWTKEEAIGQLIGPLIYKADDAKRTESIDVLLEKEAWAGDLTQITRDGKKLIVEARWTLVRDEHGGPKAVLAINTDITERKKIEAQFLRAQRMESIGTLASGIAHDLNNILGPIMMAVEVLKSHVRSPQAIMILETLEISAHRGADIVRQVLSFGRGLEGTHVEVQGKHLFKDMEHIIRDTFPKDIRFRLDAGEDTWTVLGDPTQLHQVLLNLCVNARDAMPHGGLLTVNMANKVLDEQYAAMNVEARPGNYVVITVSDTGSGIPPEILDKIFEPFFTTKEASKGTGLGLSTVLAIVKSHDGFVNVSSEPEKGTVFRIYLPAKSGMGQQEESPAPVNVPRGNGEVILVIDDESTILTITSQTLEAFGYRVLVADNGADGIGIYAQQRREIAAVLMDMMMPVIDGAATIHAMKRINPAVRIIAVSGLSANGHNARAEAAGVKHFLTKPYTARTLLEKLRQVLDED